MSFYVKNLQQMNNYVNENLLTPGGCLFLARGFIHAYVHYLIIFFSETSWPIKANFHVGPPWEDGTKVYIDSPCHNQTVRYTYVWLIPFKISRTKHAMIFKHGMQHRGLILYEVHINDETGLTLTYFTARLHLVAYVFEWKKRLQSHLMENACRQIPN